VHNGLDVDIQDCLLADQFRFRRALTVLKRKSATDSAAAQALAGQMRASADTVTQRRKSMPVVSLAAGLPISDKRDLIAEALQKHQIIIVAGETGSGKTTQIPKICLQLGYGVKGLIGHTQPRRLAARSVAARIAEELNQALGKGVGYQVRFSDNTDASTWIKLMTDGILLAEIQQDRFLNKYEVLIIDEAHERSLNIDFLLGYLKQLSRRRPELKIIVTSATIDVEKFSAHFDNAPIISVSGRSFPVEILYEPPQQDDTEDNAGSDDPLNASVISAIHNIDDRERRQRKAAGDILVFLSGEREIRDLAQALRQQQLHNTEVLPLYARLSHDEQKRIFSGHSGRRIILSTNVAETSLTVPGIIYVIDTGLARISRYSVQNKVQRLPIERISQASANQRAGRCGRIASGTCIRLYSEEDFNSRALFTEPEIQRTNLSAVILQMLLLKLGDIADFPFVERPEPRAINDGFSLLQELGAIDRSKALTESGRKMASLPADPRLSCMLIDAAARHCLPDMLIIVSALGVQDPREFPPDKKQIAREKHKHFSHPESDFLSWVRLWNEFEEQRQALTQNALKQYCKQNFLSFMRMREWRETHRQLTLSCQQLGFRSRHPETDSGAQRVIPEQDNAQRDYQAIHRAIVRGSLNQLGMKSEDNFYQGARGRKFVLLPASSLFRKQPKWIVSAELIETHRVFASMAARIEPEWAAEAAAHLVKREHFEAHWEKKRGQVIAFEKVNLFGLTLIERQRVDFGKIDARLSREIFIREALVGDQLETKAAFYHKNRALIAEIRIQEEKQRRPDILISDEQLFEFYASRIPDGICDSRSFENWRKTVAANDPRFLEMSSEDLLQRPMDEAVATEFPDHAHIGDNRLKIDYRFTPGSSDDGASINIPLAMLNRVGELELEWAVPGQVRERCVALIKALPKAVRKQFIPVAEFVDAALQGVEPGRERLIDIISRTAARQGILLDRDQWQQISAAPDALPAHLKTKIRVLDEKGKELACSDSLETLQNRFSKQFSSTVSTIAKHPLEQEGFKEWSFEELPEQIEIEHGVRLVRYPALIDNQESVAVRLLDDQTLALAYSRKGVARLLMFRTAQQRIAISKLLQQLEKKLALKLPGGMTDSSADGVAAVYTQAFNLTEKIPRNADEFEACLNAGKPHLLSSADELARLLEQIYELFFQLNRTLNAMQKSEFAYAIRDIREQLAELLFVGFVATTPWHWLKQYPRFLKAIEQRIQKMPAQIQKDKADTIDIADLHKTYLQKMHSNKSHDSINEFPWLLQELRVSLFAQTLKTTVPVSVQRLHKKLAPL